MNEAKLFYTAPPDENFEELREAALKIWRAYHPEHRKAEYVLKMSNIENNFMAIVNMFDCDNQRKLAHDLSDSTKLHIATRFIDGGSPYPEIKRFL